MSESSGSQISPLLCKCRLLAPVVTSWKEDNIGRRFYGCPNYPDVGCCKYFRWIDPPLCERSMVIIRGLLRRTNQLRGENCNLVATVHKLEESVLILQGEVERLEEGLKKHTQMAANTIENTKANNLKNEKGIGFRHLGCTVLLLIIVLCLLKQMMYMMMIGDGEDSGFKMIS